MIRTAIFFVPHPDDELLVGGGLLFAFANNTEWKTIVVYSTNGDFFVHEGLIRIREAISSCTYLGVKEENIVFLGYGNEWKTTNIYNADPYTQLVSHAGICETYGIDGHQDYSYATRNYHQKYSRSNYIEDIVSIITSNMPDVIVSVDFDSHPDHRVLNLLFREALKIILVNNEKYQPLVLTKFAYENVMKGKKDYYKQPHPRTISEYGYLTSSPFPTWNQRISFRTPPECDVVKLTNNPLYIASLAHKSQGIQNRMDSSINADMTYWRIHTNNISLSSIIEVSSGNGEFINDNKIIDTHNIDSLLCEFNKGIWIPEDSDKDKKVIIKFIHSYCIKAIEIYENPMPGKKIYQIAISIGNYSKEYDANSLIKDGSLIRLELDEEVVANEVTVRVLDCASGAGITEIVVLNQERTIDSFLLPCTLYEENSCNVCNSWDYLIGIIDKIYYKGRCFLRKVFINKYVVMRKYPITIENKRLIVLYRIIHFFRRLYVFTNII